MTALVSIIICTRDRAESLRQTLESLNSCELPPDLPLELVVVDNGSTDHTKQIIDHAVFHGSPVRRIVEPAPGLSRARNAGLQATASEVILFTDDDVRFPAGWIAGMCRPIASGEVDAVAGGVHFPAAYEPQLAQEPFRSRRGWLASTEDTDAREPGCLVGANMAFSRQVVDAIGGFDPALGAGALGFCEESLFAMQLIAAGFRIKTAFEISVEHHFDLSRLTRETLLSMATRMGRSAAYVDYHWKHEAAAAARSRARRASALLCLERLKGSLKKRGRAISIAETQRIQTLAYWRQMAELGGQPYRYPRDGATGS